MSKVAGFPWYFVVGGTEISNDIGTLDNVAAPMGTVMETGLDKRFVERLGTEHSGALDFTAYFNTSANRAHAVLSALPRTDIQVSALADQAIGNAMVSIVAKQLNYDPSRSEAGDLTAKVSTLSNANGIEWGVQVTPGFKTDTTGTNGTGYDQTTVSTSFGWQAYLHVTALTGTNVILTLQDSADNVSFANLTGGAFTSATAAGAQRLAGGSTATVRRYVRVVSSGTFTSATFAVNFIRNVVAVP